MPTPGQLVTKLSEVLTLPEPTVSVFDRALRDAGLLGKAGRGRGSVQRTTLDLARLLIAVLATNSPARAAEAVLDFGCLYLNSSREADPNNIRLSELWEGASTSHNFEQALEGLIAGFGQQSFRDAMVAHLHPATGNALTQGYFPRVAIELHVTEVAINIDLDANRYFYRHPTFAAFATPLIDLTDANIASHTEATAPYWAMLGKYRGILTRRTVTFDQLRLLSEFVCNVPEEDRLE